MSSSSSSLTGFAGLNVDCVVVYFFFGGESSRPKSKSSPRSKSSKLSYDFFNGFFGDIFYLGFSYYLNVTFFEFLSFFNSSFSVRLKSLTFSFFLCFESNGYFFLRFFFKISISSKNVQYLQNLFFYLPIIYPLFCSMKYKQGDAS